jgi:hypothetical protein
MSKINREETVITGRWFFENGPMHADEACARIYDLIHNYLERLGTDSTGWDTLYLDPADGRHWELIYPQSEMQGGGPPELRFVDEEQVSQKYAVLHNPGSYKRIAETLARLPRET